MRLYDIATDFEAFLAAVEAGDIPEEAIADTLDGIQYSFEEKADNVACVYKNLLAEATALKAEEGHLAERRKAKESRAERMKQYLLEQMQRVNQTKLETARNSIAVRQGPPALVAHDEKALYAVRPDLFSVSEPTLNKTMAKEAMKNGAELPGCELVRKAGLTIK